MEISIIALMAIVGGSAFIITLIATPFSIWIANKTGAIDEPDGDRRIHKIPTPRIGGIGIFLGTTLVITAILLLSIFEVGGIIGSKAYLIDLISLPLTGRSLQIVGILIAGGVIFLFGLIDDYKNLSPKVKLVSQIVSATIVFAFGARINFLSFFTDYNVDFSTLVSYIFTVLWVVAITNTINLVDGLDGLASGTVTIATLALAYIGYIYGFYVGAIPMIAIAGATLGFLPFNFYPAKTFMGDCGSQYLGFMLASFSMIGTIKSATLMAVILPGLALSLPIIDTLFAIVRRKLSGKSIMQADKGHLHHRMIKSGMGQRRTVLCMYGICAIMGVAAILYSRQLYLEMIALVMIAIVYIVVVLSDIDGKKIDNILGKK